MIDRQKFKSISLERWRHDVERRKRKKKFKASRVHAEPVSFVSYRSKILDSFRTKFITHKNRRIVSPKHFRLPAVFSLTLNAEETIGFIQSVADYSRSARRPRITLDHRYVKELGLAAEAVLAVVLKEVSLENQNVPGAYIRGYKSQSPKVRKIMDEVGCVRVLRTGVDEDVKVSLRSTANVFRHQNRGKSLVVDALTADPISVTTKEFSDHLNSCLSLVGKRLSAKGRDRLLSYVAEVLINAQEHSESAQWTIVGFVDQEDEGLVYRAAIFSLGKTIAQTFSDLPDGSYSWGVVSPYIEQHGNSGFFDIHWRTEDLLTVVALQGNISSKLDGPSSDRGQGTVDLIEFFQDMSNECSVKDSKPMMSIISGSTHIRFDGGYRMKNELSLGRMVIAFNTENSLLLPPDKKVVRAMDKTIFPGVMISIAMPLATGTVEEIPPENGYED